ncbi:phosphatidylglycerol/phosphatidylinositol transfer protein [Zygosaccharomyces mellis]|uniref:Phosphatidylglycerol/phosphatidylinositol transfer protein n=1 Tax=Zygosaccharomyces mellis TaxID=42258 RepID=A0A4C2DZ28_9SACH|nr:phosphatidylglycerol/phosphatidylinositol transfer protein [Zygosaccharomyces mellis]
MYLFLTLLTLFSTIFASFLPFEGFNSLEVQQLVNTKPIPGGSPIVQCDINERQLLDIESVELSPNPPRKGHNLTILASGQLHRELVEGAYVDVEVRLGYIRLLYETYDLCEQLDEHDVDDLKCPIKPGAYNLNKEVSIPAEVPPGRYIFVVRAYTYEDELVSCITGEVLFPAGQVRLF